MSLISKGSVVASAVSAADGSFQILTGIQGRFYLVVSARSFRQLETPGFYAGRLDTIERSLVLEPEWVRESIVVTATGTPTPEPQTNAAITVLGPTDLALSETLVNPLRLMPGTSVAQDRAARRADLSVYPRRRFGFNKILMDGVSIGDLGGRFDFGPLSTTAIEHAEVYRGPNSSLYGADAASGVVSMTTPHGTTSFPSVLFHGDVGNFIPHMKIWNSPARTTNSTTSVNTAGCRRRTTCPMMNSTLAQRRQLGLAAQRVHPDSRHRALWRRCTGVPNAWQFYHVADNATAERSGPLPERLDREPDHSRTFTTSCAMA